jgi:hypothetical protein
MSKARIKPIKTVITVAKEGADFDDLAEAVNSITSLSEGYLIVIAPGVYTLRDTLKIKPNIQLVGSGQGMTILNGSVSSDSSGNYGALINNLGGMSYLSVKNNASGLKCSGITTGLYSETHDVDISVSGSCQNAYGVVLGSAMVHDVDISINSSDNVYGVYIKNARYVQGLSGTNITLRGSSSDCIGIYLAYNSIIESINSLKINSYCSGSGIFSENRSRDILLNDVEIFSNSLNAPSTGITYWSGSVVSKLIIRRSTISGKGNAIDLVSNFDNNIVFANQSTLIGGVEKERNKGKFKCVACDDGQGNELDGSCL